MKPRISVFTVGIFSLSFFLTACQKEDITATDYITEVTNQGDDHSRFSSEIDAVANDVNAALEVSAGFAGRTGNILSVICDADIEADTLGSNRTITITYNGANCLVGQKRTGKVVISMAQNVRWKNAGAVLSVNYLDLKVIRLSDNKSITISGIQTFTNVSGGLLINLPTLRTITHTIKSSQMNITLDNGAKRTWQVARRRVYSLDNGIVISTSGTYSEGATIGISEWGSNRFGTAFTSSILQPLIIRQACNYRLISGRIDHTTKLYNAKVIFGLDSAGVAVTCPINKALYLKITWRGPSRIERIVSLPY